MNRGLILCLLSSLVGCRDPAVEPEPLKLDATFKEWCTYKPGTWWTYNEIFTSATDSFWVSSYLEEVAQDPDDNTYVQFGMDINSLNDTFDIHHYRGNPSSTTAGLWSFGEIAAYNQGLIGYGRFYYTTAPPIQLYGIIQSNVDSIVLSSATYYDVVKVENQSQTYGNWIRTEYYVKNIGVVRREMFSGQIWELENYNIVQ